LDAGIGNAVRIAKSVNKTVNPSKIPYPGCFRISPPLIGRYGASLNLIIALQSFYAIKLVPATYYAIFLGRGCRKGVGIILNYLGGGMGRPLRIKAPDLTYHITSRTNGRRMYMKKKRDQKMLCRILKFCLLKHCIVIYAFTPMMNHFHMMIRFNQETDLSRFMGEFKSTYAKYFNRKYGSGGHFWGERYRSTIVQDDRHALACLRYIDRNAVKAGLVDHPGKWFLTSFHSYAYGENHPLLPLRPHPTYLALSDNKTKRRAMYLAFVVNKDTFSDELHGRIHKLQFFGSAEFIEEVKQAL
jgi:putative transposase